MLQGIKRDMHLRFAGFPVSISQCTRAGCVRFITRESYRAKRFPLW